MVVIAVLDASVDAPAAVTQVLFKGDADHPALGRDAFGNIRGEGAAARNVEAEGAEVELVLHRIDDPPVIAAQAVAGRPVERHRQVELGLVVDVLTDKLDVAAAVIEAIF